MAWQISWLKRLLSLEVHLLRFQPVAYLSTTSQPLKKSKLVEESTEISAKGEFLFGVSPCLAALRANRRKIHAIYMKPGNSYLQRPPKSLAERKIVKLAKKKEVEIQHVHRRVLGQLSKTPVHEGIVIDADPLDFEHMEYADSEISKEKREENPLWLVLNKTNDPISLGAIIRTACFLGVDRIITLAAMCCPLTPSVSKASLGAMEMMPVYALSGCGLGHFLFNARGNGWTVLETTGSKKLKERERERGGGEREEGEEFHRDVEEAKAKKLPVIDCRDYCTNGPTIVVLGSKSYGLHTESNVERVSTALLTITPSRELPQELDYLNTSVAAGIILYSLQKGKQTSITKKVYHSKK